MTSAELNENGKRVRHCFPRREVMHRFIHSGAYVYSNQRYRTSGKYNWLFAFTLNKNANENTITYGWDCNCSSNARNCIAVINRDIKVILVNTTFFKRSDELLSAIPDNYRVFLTDETIVNPYILSTGELEQAIKAHAKYLTKQFVNRYLHEFYGAFAGTRKVVHQDIKSLFKCKDKNYVYKGWYNCINYDDIYHFAKEYKINRYDWYDKPFDEVLEVRDDINWSTYNYYKVPCPSIKQIINGTIFNKKQKLELEQRYFYGCYCHGYGIYFSKLQARWNNKYDRDEFEKLFAKHNIKINLDNRPELIYWRDGIKLYAKAIESNTKKALEDNIHKSTDNYNKACERYNNQYYEERLKGWRDFCPPRYCNDYIEYDKFVVDSTKHGTGHWVTDRCYPRTKFSNIQLRYRKDNIGSRYDVIETSNHATVTLEQAISMYKLYKRVIAKDNPQIGKIIKHDFSNKGINVGLYNLRTIEYRQKQTDNGDMLDKWEYVVIIGCHHIWIDDFIDFVKYYNLEDKFGIN